MADYSRRELLKRAAYAAPVIVTLPAVPSFAQTGSGGSLNCADLQVDSNGIILPGQDDLVKFCLPDS